MTRMQKNQGAGRPFGIHKSFFSVCVLVALSVVSMSRAAAAQAAPAQPGDKIQILLLTDATKPLTVHYESKGRVARDLVMSSPLTGGLGSIIADMSVDKHETTKESQTLQQTVGTFNRRIVIEAGIKAAFKAGTKCFEVVAPPDPSVYITGKDINFSKAQVDGYPYVLFIQEKFAGLATVWGMGTLSAGSGMEFKLTDAATGRELGKGKTSSFSTNKREFDPATTDKMAFIMDYAAAAGHNIGDIYGQLTKGGQLHAMAEARGRGNEVPDVEAVQARYEKLFDYDLAVPKDWSQKAVSKYTVNLEPKNSDQANFGVSFSVELSVEELGQKVDDLNGFIRLYFDRMQTAGFPTETAASFTGLALDPQYSAFVVDRPKAPGKDILVFRRLNDTFVVIYDLVFLNDYDGFLKKYGPDVQSLINNSRITTRP